MCNAWKKNVPDQSDEYMNAIYVIFTIHSSLMNLPALTWRSTLLRALLSWRPGEIYPISYSVFPPLSYLRLYPRWRYPRSSDSEAEKMLPFCLHQRNSELKFLESSVNIEFIPDLVDWCLQGSVFVLCPVWASISAVPWQLAECWQLVSVCRGWHAC